MYTHVGYPVTSCSEHRDVSVVQSTLAILTWLLSSLLNSSASCSHVGAKRLQCPHLRCSTAIITWISSTRFYTFQVSAACSTLSWECCCYHCICNRVSRYSFLTIRASACLATIKPGIHIWVCIRIREFPFCLRGQYNNEDNNEQDFHVSMWSRVL
jgi:hypothetical protein